MNEMLNYLHKCVSAVSTPVSETGPVKGCHMPKAYILARRGAGIVGTRPPSFVTCTEIKQLFKHSGDSLHKNNKHQMIVR